MGILMRFLLGIASGADREIREHCVLSASYLLLAFVFKAFLSNIPARDGDGWAHKLERWIRCA